MTRILPLRHRRHRDQWRRPTGNNITEVAAILHDVAGLDRWVRLIQPRPIPLGITRLTGIDDHMVANAPEFGALAEDLHTFLGDAVFVAHNVSFDLHVTSKRDSRPPDSTTTPVASAPCGCRRKWLKGPHRYSLGALCEYFDIDNEAHHRAWGDAAATAGLFAVEGPCRRHGPGIRTRWRHLVR